MFDLSNLFWIALILFVAIVTVYGVRVFSGDLAKLTDPILIRRAKFAIGLWVLSGVCLVGTVVWLRLR